MAKINELRKNYNPKKPIFNSSNIQLITKTDNLKDYVNNLNKYCASLQNENYQEVVGDDIMWQARRYVNRHDILDLKDTYDILKYAASLNLLNTFVKQKIDGKKNKLISYYFKSFILDRLIMAIVDNNIKDVVFDISKDGAMSICYIKIYNMIFSFHNVYVSLKDKEALLKSNKRRVIKFDNNRKQKVAVTLYKNVLNYR